MPRHGFTCDARPCWNHVSHAAFFHDMPCHNCFVQFCFLEELPLGVLVDLLEYWARSSFFGENVIAKLIRMAPWICGCWYRNLGTRSWYQDRVVFQMFVSCGVTRFRANELRAASRHNASCPLVGASTLNWGHLVDEQSLRNSNKRGVFKYYVLCGIMILSFLSESSVPSETIGRNTQKQWIGNLGALGRTWSHLPLGPWKAQRNLDFPLLLVWKRLGSCERFRSKRDSLMLNMFIWVLCCYRFCLCVREYLNC